MCRLASDYSFIVERDVPMTTGTVKVQFGAVVEAKRNLEIFEVMYKALAYAGPCPRARYREDAGFAQLRASLSAQWQSTCEDLQRSYAPKKARAVEISDLAPYDDKEEIARARRPRRARP